ncbi:MAG: hypothetical protein Fur0027_07300 [Raineya sp.]
MKLLGGFLNTNKQTDGCVCGNNYYTLPLKGGDEFYLIVENEDRAINTNLPYMLVATYGTRKIYRFIISEIDALRTNNILNWGGYTVNIATLCYSIIEEFCGVAVQDLCTTPFAFGQTCFRYADCYDSVLEWQQKYLWYPSSSNYFAFKQRLPIRLTKPQAKIEGIKTYQKSSGTVLRIGKIRQYIEYTLETDFMPEIFHRQLVEVLTTARNLKINNKSIEFAGDYQIDWQSKQDCFAKATCKIIEKIGSPINC